MATKYFLKIPNVVGGVLATGRLGWIDVISETWGHGRPIDPATDVVAGRAKPKLFRITKQVDSASPDIGALMIARTTVDAMDFHVHRTELQAPGNILQVRLVGAVIESQIQSGSSGALLLEEVAISYGRMEVRYYKVDSAGVTTFFNQYFYTPVL